jgi:hypothetical protein
MITKKKLLQTIQNLPEKFSVDELLDRIMLLQKIELGIEQSASGKVSSTSEAKKKLKKWLK